MSKADSNHEPISISIDIDIIDAVDAFCSKTMQKRSQVFQQAALEYLAKERAARCPATFLSMLKSVDRPTE